MNGFQKTVWYHKSELKATNCCFQLMVHFFLLLKCDHHTLENKACSLNLKLILSLTNINKLTAEVDKNILEIQSN